MTGDVTRPTSARLEDLALVFRPDAEELVRRLAAEGYEPRVYETYRSPERAEWLGDHGVSKVGADSLHCDRLALDIIDGRKGPDGRPVMWGASVRGVSEEHAIVRRKMAHDFFAVLGAIATSAGLVWGGSWRQFRDLAHVQVGDRHRGR